jgi:cytidyltransferase-like protein
MAKAYYSGSFDLFHVGHLAALKEAAQIAKAHDAQLIVGVNTDELYLQHKGKLPVIPFTERLQIVRALKIVDKAVAEAGPTMTNNLKKYGITHYIICDDYGDNKSEESGYMASIGGQVLSHAYHQELPSSTKTKEKINGR